MRPSPPWLRPLLLLTLLLELLGASAVLRSDLFTREPIAAALTRVGDRLGGTFTFAHVTPRGLTGLEVNDLVFHPAADSGLPEVSVARVLLYPRLDRLALGEVALAEVFVDGLAARLDESGLRALRERFATTNDGLETAPAAANSRLPDALHLRAAEVELVDDRLAGGSVFVSLPDLRVAFEASDHGRRVHLDGDLVLDDRVRTHLVASLGGASAPEVRLDAPEAPDWLAFLARDDRLPGGTRLRAAAITLASANELVLEGLVLDGLTTRLPLLDAWHVASLEADELRLDRTPDGPVATLSRAAITLSSANAATRIDVLQARAPLVTRETDSRTLGAAAPRTLSATLGGGSAGTCDLRFDPASATEPWRVTADAHHYRIDQVAPLLADTSPVRVPEGRFSGSLAASPGAEPDTYGLAVQGTLEDGVADAPFLAARPMQNVTVGLGGDLTLDNARQNLIWRDGRILLAGVPVSFEASLSWSDEAPRLRLEARLEDVDANELRRGLPEGLAPSLERVALAGTLSATIDVDLDATHPEDAELGLDLDASRLVVADFGPDVPITRLDGDFAIAIPTTDGLGRVVSTTTGSWVTYDEVSDFLVPALVSAEDGRFFSHDGFDWRAIEASVELNLRERRIVRGGSTISQQVVRSLFLGSERTLGRKFEEAFLTWQLEQYVPKRRIMELYVNAVHWGPGVYGIAEASATYFHRRPDELTVGEAAFLASILPNPDYFGTQYARHLVPPSRREKVCNILRNMRNSGAISERVATRTCRDAENGIVSVVPPPEWLVEPPPAAPPAPDTIATRPVGDLALASTW